MSQQPVEVLLESLYGMPQVGADWRQFLSRIGDAFRAHVIAFHTHDVLHQQGEIDTSVGLADTMVPRFKALVHEHPWYVNGGERLLRDGMADDEGLLPEAELFGTRFYEEILKPSHVGHGMALVLHQDGPTNIALLTINRDRREGFYRSSERTLAKALLPHLRAAYLLQQRLGWIDSLARSFRCALDHLEEGIVLLDRKGCVRFANVAASRLATENLFALRLDRQFRLPTTAQSNQLMQYLLANSGSRNPLSMRIVDGMGRWVGMLKVCPAGQVAVDHWSEPNVEFIVFLGSARPATFLADKEHWQQLWRLTRAEASLAQHLAKGLSLTEAADASGVSKNTVRTQLRGILNKTGTQRQQDLVRLLMLCR